MPIPIKSANFSRMEERIRKLKAEIETARRIHEQNCDPLEVLTIFYMECSNWQEKDYQNIFLIIRRCT